MRAPTPKVSVGFGSTWKTADGAITWEDVTDRVLQARGITVTRGRSSELDDYRAGKASFTLDNRGRLFDPSYSAGDYFGDLLPGVPVKIEAVTASTAVPVTITSVLAEGTSANAAFYETTASFTPVAGRHYFVGVAWGSADTGDPATITSTTGLDFVPAACPGADGSCFARPSALRRVQHFIALADGTETSGKVRIDVPAAVPEFSDLGIIVTEIANAHHGSAATDCLVQAGRVDTTSNGESVGTFLHPFTDSTTNATLVFATNGGAHTMTAGSGLTSLVQVSAGSLFRLGVFVQTTTPALEPATTWTGAASPSIVAYEVRAAGSAAPSTFDAVPRVFNDDISVSTLTLTSVPFTTGRPMLIGVVSGRTDGANTPTSVTGATNAFTLVGSSTGFDTVGTPLRKITAWLCANPTAVTEDVVVTWAGAQNSNGFAAVAIDLPAGATASTVSQSDGDAADATTTLTGTLTAPIGGVLVLAGSDTIATQIVPGTGSGLRMLFNSNGQSGNNGASWTSGSARKMAGFWRDTPAASVSATLETARDAGLLALEITPALASVPYTWPVFRGFVDGWPQDYPEQSDAMPVVNVSCTDGFGKLATAGTPTGVAAIEIAADEPTAWWRFSETAGTSAADLGPDHLYNLTYDSDISSSSSTHPNPWESVPGVDFGQSGGVDGATTSDVNLAAELGVPITFEWMWKPTTQRAGASGSFGEFFDMQYGHLYIDCSVAETTPGVEYQLTIVFNDGASSLGRVDYFSSDYSPSHFAYRKATTGGAAELYVNGVLAYTGTGGVGTLNPFHKINVGVGVYSFPSPGGVLDGPFGDFAFYNSDIGATRIQAHAAAFTAPWDLDTTGERLVRILDLVGWPASLRDIATGVTILGPATLGQKALALGKNYEKSEQGRLFISRDGSVTFLDRHYNLTVTEGMTSQATFSDDGADIPYTGVGFDYDDRLVFNRVRGSRTGGSTIEVIDQTSIDTYGEQVDSALIGMQVSNEATVRAAAEFRLDRYKQPALRARPIELKLHGLTAAQQETVLGLELGYRVRIERTPEGLGSSITQETVIEGVSHRMTGGAHTTTLTLSPVDTRVYGLWGSGLWGTALWAY